VEKVIRGEPTCQVAWMTKLLGTQELMVKVKVMAPEVPLGTSPTFQVTDEPMTPQGAPEQES